MNYLNLTQHLATPEQRKAGVFDLTDERGEVCDLLTFDEMPSESDLRWRAEYLADIAEDICVCFGGSLEDETAAYSQPCGVMIGGAPWFMPYLVDELKARGLRVFFAFSKRESVDVEQSDGMVRKTAVFRHLGFVEA